MSHIMIDHAFVEEVVNLYNDTWKGIDVSSRLSTLCDIFSEDVTSQVYLFKMGNCMFRHVGFDDLLVGIQKHYENAASSGMCSQEDCYYTCQSIDWLKHKLSMYSSLIDDLDDLKI